MMRNIQAYQRGVSNLIPRLSFQRLVREISQDYRTDLRFQSEGLLALQVHHYSCLRRCLKGEDLQEASEMFLIRAFEDLVRLATHGKRVTVMAPDLACLKFIRWEDFASNICPKGRRACDRDFQDEQKRSVAVKKPLKKRARHA
jgi:histone H3/H4